MNYFLSCVCHGVLRLPGTLLRQQHVISVAKGPADAYTSIDRQPSFVPSPDMTSSSVSELGFQLSRVSHRSTVSAPACTHTRAYE